MIKWILCFIKGYLVVDFKGNALERLLSQIIDSGIELWSINRISKSHYRAKIIMKDFSKLRPIMRKRMCIVSINQKKGLPFLRYKIRQRYFLILGFILFIIIIYCASSFLWFININGLDKIKEDRIYNILYKYDIKPGTPKRELDLDEIEKILLQEESNISWVNLDWQGTRLNIEIVEKKLIEEQKTDKIVAARNGIINELIVLRGRSIVEEGETVTENQVLILPGKSSDDLRMEAIVKAEVWYETFGEAQFEEKEPVYTGDTITKWKINLGSYTFEIPNKDIRFDEYVIQKRKKNLPKWRNISIPIELNKEKYNEVEYLIEERNYDETLYHAKNQALKKMLKKLSSSTVILESKFEIVDIDEEDKILVRMLLKSEENIAKKVSNSN